MLPVELPNELLILILSYLPLRSLSALSRVDKMWNGFMEQNANTVYRNAAWMEGMIPSEETLLEELYYPEEGMRSRSCYSKRAMRGVKDWRDFCRRRKLIGKSWEGHAPSAIRTSPRVLPNPLPSNIRQRTPYRRVHRIKVDEKLGMVMTTSAVGGLIVRDLETDEVIWELPTWYVRAHAHLEYGEGYVIFDRDDGNKEVWSRTDDRSTVTTSFPDGRQLQMRTRMQALGHNLFTPYALFIMPENTRAYRFVYPTLLVASLERAFLWDIRSGELVQTLDGIQIVLPLDSFDEQDEQTDVRSDSSYHSDSESDPPLQAGQGPGSPQSIPLAFDSDTEEEENDGDTLPEFLGIIHYVELSERHVIIVGRYLLRVFSRLTGKSVLDIPSTLPRYGAAKWEVRSRQWAMQEGRRGSGYHIDDYTQARREGRELVRMPLQFTYEGYREVSNLLIDQFDAAHISSDGKHIVALLDGSRIIVIHDFEAICVTIASLSSLVHPVSAAVRHSVVASSSGTPTPPRFVIPRPQRQAVLTARQIRDTRKRIRREKEKLLYDHTYDIQLGPPHASTSIYLAYDHGRIGVVTTNAVYIVTIGSPPSPLNRRVSQAAGTFPSVRVSRVPYFSSSMWLACVSCLMISDTGLFLNWNFTSPPPPPVTLTQLDEPDDVLHEGNMDGSEDMPGAFNLSAALERDFRVNQAAIWEKYEDDYQNALLSAEVNPEEQFYVLPNGDMIIRQHDIELNRSQVSTVYAVDFSVGDPGSEADV